MGVLGNVKGQQMLTSGQEDHAQVILARRTECLYVTPLRDMTDDALRREVDNLNTLFPVLGDGEHVLQPHVERIRATCAVSNRGWEETTQSYSDSHAKAVVANSHAGC